MFGTALPALAVALTQQLLGCTPILSRWAKCSLSGGEAHELLHAHTRSLPVESSPPRGSCTLWQLCLVPGKNYTRVQGRPCKARYVGRSITRTAEDRLVQCTAWHKPWFRNDRDCLLTEPPPRGVTSSHQTTRSTHTTLPEQLHRRRAQHTYSSDRSSGAPVAQASAHRTHATS